MQNIIHKDLLFTISFVVKKPNKLSNQTIKKLHMKKVDNNNKTYLFVNILDIDIFHWEKINKLVSEGIIEYYGQHRFF